MNTMMHILPWHVFKTKLEKKIIFLTFEGVTIIFLKMVKNAIFSIFGGSLQKLQHKLNFLSLFHQTAMSYLQSEEKLEWKYFI